MPVAETASTFNEVLTVSAAIDAAESDDEKLALIESQLSDACQIICDIYSRYLFESAVFAARPEEFLDPDRLCQMMLEAQKKAYGDGLDQTWLLQLPLCLRRPVCPWPVCQVSAGGQGFRAAV